MLWQVLRWGGDRAKVDILVSCSCIFIVASRMLALTLAQLSPLSAASVASTFPACILSHTKPLAWYDLAEQDRLPTPFGLVRSGVAPDHPDTKVLQVRVDIQRSGRIRSVCVSLSPDKGLMRRMSSINIHKLLWTTASPSLEMCALGRMSR